ncbi:MAG: hypothetical protein F6K63_29860 [Moorea sp. SIO1G6]|uniref:hypothetical protein n=1 Tax=Moorena sp. SIO1G6 TaxID=2607840 RepID=UPI0013BF9057|nr:hypothetical protein [Moorena sp. SIO1G6]NET68376.1 hypothetical protein [Moorena sp. SIO1G6]
MKHKNLAELRRKVLGYRVEKELNSHINTKWANKPTIKFPQFSIQKYLKVKEYLKILLDHYDKSRFNGQLDKLLLYLVYIYQVLPNDDSLFKELTKEHSEKELKDIALKFKTLLDAHIPSDSKLHQQAIPHLSKYLDS